MQASTGSVFSSAAQPVDVFFVVVEVRRDAQVVAAGGDQNLAGFELLGEERGRLGKRAGDHGESKCGGSSKWQTRAELRRRSRA